MSDTVLERSWAKARPAVRNRARWIILTESRPEQRTPEGDWNVWLYMAGRGSGKTRAAAEDMSYYGLTHPDSRLAVVAPTFADARDTCIEGESGLLAVLPPEEIADWNRSLGELILHNGTRYKLFSGDKPDRLRGPQHHRAWCDELAAFRYQETWDMLAMTMRLGEHPQVVATTTPKPVQVIVDLLERAGADVRLTRGSTYDNARNLAPAALESFRRRYEGTRLGRQELMGELLQEVEGALWTMDLIAADRVAELPPHLPPGNRIVTSRIVVAVDPAASSGPDSDETGIIAVAAIDGHAYPLADRTLRGTPQEWATAAINLYRDLGADRIVAEKNNGGEMVEAVLRAVDPSIPYKAVWASRGKHKRAEPVSALYEQHRVHHVGVLADLESELTTWTPDDAESPNRLDALVWGVTELLLSGGDVRFGQLNDDGLGAPSFTGDIPEKVW